MDLNDIVVFTKVVETKSFTGAAELLGLPKSTVSRKLAQLEERLGVRLVQRTTRKLALTDIGQAYYERCSRIVADVAAAEQLVTDMQSTPRGRLRVTAPVDLSMRYLGSIIADFLATHSDINIELEATDRIVDLIEEGFDLAVRFGTLPESTLIARRLCSFSAVMCASPAYLAQARHADDDRGARRARSRAVHAEPADPELDPGPRRPDLRVRPSGAVRQQQRRRRPRGGRRRRRDRAAHRLHRRERLRARRLAYVLPEWTGRAIEVNAVYPARQNLPPRLSLFLDHLAKALAPPPWAPAGPPAA